MNGAKLTTVKDAGASGVALSESPVRSKQARGKQPSAISLFFQKYNILPSILFFVFWELFSRVNGMVKFFNPNFLPAPTSLLSEGWELAKTGIITDSIISSTIRIALGFVIGSAIAVGLGVIMSKFKTVERWFSPILNLVGPIPSLALLPLFIIWFGIGSFRRCC